MSCLLKHVVWLVLVSLCSCTDLLAVYKHDILLVRDVDKIKPKLPLSWDKHVLDLPEPLLHPMGLAHDSQNNRLFVAEAVQGKILALMLDDEYNVMSMTTAVKHTQKIEGMSYDPRSKQLFWADSDTHSIKKATVSEKLVEEGASEPELIRNLGNIWRPRGVAVDPCKEWLYWSERGTVMVNSSVEMYNLKGNKLKVLSGIKKENEYFQGLTFDYMRESLVLGLTVGDNVNTSSCRFVSQSLLVNKDFQDLLTLNNCYPFSVTVEDNYLYWVDWGSGGIMRAHISNPDSVVKLVDTPMCKSGYGNHQGAFGLVLINTKNTPLLDKCIEYKTSTGTESETDKKDSGQVNATEITVNRFGGISTIADSIDKEAKIEKELAIGGSKKASTTKTDQEYLVSKDNRSEEIISNPSVKSSEEVAGNEKASKKDFETVTDLSDLQLQSANSSYKHGNSLINPHRCSEEKLMLWIVVLSGVCMLLFVSTVALLVKLYCHRQYNPCNNHNISSTVDGTQASHTQPRQVKRFGPKKHFVSRGKAKMTGVSACSQLSSAGDGVSINIEDCCQMTLCETPCYTSVKKEGKTYHNNSQNTKGYEDKKSLLDNYDEI